MFKKSNGKIKGGFTLIELLVVIAIIVLLAALSLRSISRAVINAKVNRAVAEMANFAITYEQVKANLPQFYYCRLEDLAKFDPQELANGPFDIGGIRIWDNFDTVAGISATPAIGQRGKGLSDNDLYDIAGTDGNGDLVQRTLRDVFFTTDDATTAGAIRNYWHGPYITFQRTILVNPGNDVPNSVVAPFTAARSGYRPLDPWDRQYRMFWYADDAAVAWDDAINAQLIPRGAVGTMVIISAGPDGVFQSCVSDVNWQNAGILTGAQIIAGAQTILPTNAVQANFANFNPFHPNITERDPYYAFNVVVH